MNKVGSVIAACFAVAASISPWLLRMISVAWPQNIKRIAVFLVAGLFIGTMVWMFLTVKGEPIALVLVRLLIPAWSLWGLLVLYFYWHELRETDLGVTDLAATLQKAIDATEGDLKLSSIERLEKVRPVEGVHSHTIIRYAGGTWLEWLNPTDEKGIPDQTYFAVYSNDSRVVKKLVQLVGRYCNVEQQKEPLWQYDDNLQVE